MPAMDIVSFFPAACCALVPFASQRFAPVRQPCDYACSSGAYVLHVAPSDPHGNGPMHCRLNHGKEEVWSADFPWTFEEAGVAEDGSVAGYANGDNLRIAVLDSKGKLLKLHEIDHTFHVIDGPSLPSARDHVVIHSGADRAMILIAPADQSHPLPWWTFRLSTGERSEDVNPRLPLRLSEHQQLYERDARPVGDSGLTLCHWLYVDYQPEDLDWPQQGSVYSLSDLDGRSVWSLPLLDDFTDKSSEKATDNLVEEAWRSDSILAVGPGNRFTIRRLREKQAVDYTVEKDASSQDGWKITELSRRPLSEGKSGSIAVESVNLRKLSECALDGGHLDGNSPIHDVLAIGFSESGSVEFFRRQRPAGLAFVRLNSAGELENEKDLSAVLPEAKVHNFFRIKGDRWILQLFDEERPWVEVDVSTGTIIRTPQLPAGGMNGSIVPLPDGGYLALLTHLDHSAVLTSLIRVLPDGSTDWDETVPGDSEDTPLDHALYGNDEMVDVGPDKFALPSQKALTTIDLDKHVLGSVELDSLLGPGPRYVSSLRSDGKGGVYFAADLDSYQHVDARGTLLSPLTPCRADKSKTGLMLHMLCINLKDGHPWTSDGARIYRLDDHGVADMALGPAQSPDELAYPDEALVDSGGRILIRDRMTQAVHVFDLAGHRSFVCKIEPNERLEQPYLYKSMQVSPDGRLWVDIKDGLAQFDREGHRLPPTTQPSQKRNKWDEVQALDPSQNVLSGLRARPDGKWLTGGSRSSLPDGRLVILEGLGDHKCALHFYDQKGNPIKTIELPNNNGWNHFCTSSRWIAIDERGSGFVGVRLEDDRVYRLKADEPGKSHRAVGISQDGKELMLLADQPLTLETYELP